MSTLESLREYKKLHRQAKQVALYKSVNGYSPYIEALEEIVDENKCTPVNLGLISVPSELIVGTTTSARKISFAPGFLPLLGSDSEFCHKWVNLCDKHMSDSGISDAPEAIEYLGKFYVTEGNKRVSVYKAFGSPYIDMKVKRLLPDNYKNRYLAYARFLEYYEHSKLYSLQFNKADYYDKFLRLLGFEKDYDWSRQDRIRVIGLFERIKKYLKKYKITYNPSDCFYSLIELYGFNELRDFTDKELDNAIKTNVTGLRYGLGIINIACISDVENSYLLNNPKKKLEDTEFIISAGDLKSSYLEYLESATNKELFYVHGNHDDEYDTKPPLGCVCIDDDLVVYKGIRILGLGGSYRYSNGKYQYTEAEMKRRIFKLKWKIFKAGGVDIVVSHAPIAGFGDKEDFAHQGFVCFKKLLDRYEPKYWLYGHVHLNYGYNESRIYAYKKTMIINVSDYYSLKY